MSPYPAYLLVNRRTQSVLDDMAGAIQSGKGLLVLTGEVGTGKTTLVKRLIAWLAQQGTPTAFVFNPRLEPNELFEIILAGYGALSNRQLQGTARQRLDQWLIEQNAAGVRPVVVIDEAQGLSQSALEEVRLLLNEEFMGEPVIQIVLSGQPELDEMLRRPELRQLKQRLELRRNTVPFDRDEARGYIQKRLDIAGAAGKTVFPRESAEAVYFYARGVPRVINLLCENGLRRAHEKHFLCVPPEIVDEVAQELQFDERRPVAKGEQAAETVAIAMESGDLPQVTVTIEDLVAAPDREASTISFAAIEDAAEGLVELSPRPVLVGAANYGGRFSRLEQISARTGTRGQTIAFVPLTEAIPSMRIMEKPQIREAASTRVARAGFDDGAKASPIVRPDAPARHSGPPVRKKKWQTAGLFIASALDGGREWLLARFAVVGKWLSGPMPFGRRRVERAEERTTSA
jgi:general secretion pathway protein A